MAAALGQPQSAAANAAAQQQMQIGSLFGLPNITKPMDDFDNNQLVATTLQQGTQVTVNFPSTFKDTDIVHSWLMDVNINPQTITVGTATITQAEQFPYNYIGPFALELQNKYRPIDVPSTFFAKIFEMYRPVRYRPFPGVSIFDQSPASNAYSAQENLQTAGNYTKASTSVRYQVEIPTGIFFDRYFEIDPGSGYAVDARTGIQIPPVRGFFNPYLMSSGSKVVGPKVKFNAGFASSADQGPFMNTGSQTTPPTFAATGVLSFRRRGWLQPSGPLDTPPTSAWQYVRTTQHSLIGAAVKTDIKIDFPGQILSMYLYFFDPASSRIAGLTGASMDVNNVNVLQLIYGSGTYRFNDDTNSCQKRFYDQYRISPPQGCLIWDMLWDEWGLLSNGSNVLNTLTMADVHVHVELAAAQSSSFYVEIGIEGLQYSVSI